MKLPLLLTAALLCSLALADGKTEVYQTLSAKALAKKKNEDCSFVHFWATWCTICIEELPRLIKLLPSTGVKPVIVDLSDTFVQDNFSKKWIKQLNPPFTVYVKPDTKDEPYLKQAGFKWTNTLPYSYLFKGGKKVKEWDGYLDMAQLKSELNQFCSPK